MGDREEKDLLRGCNDLVKVIIKAHTFGEFSEEEDNFLEQLNKSEFLTSSSLAVFDFKR